MPNLDVTNNVFTKSLTFDNQNKVLNLQTAGNFIDKNISIQITAQTASNFSLNVSNISGTDIVSVGTLSNGYYPIIANNLSATATLSAGTAGWFSSGSAIDSDIDNIIVGNMARATFSTTCNGGNLSTTTTNINVQVSSSDSFNNNICYSTTCTRSAMTFYVNSETAGYVPNNQRVNTLVGYNEGSFYMNRYIQGVTLNKPTSGEAKFSITIPNGPSDMITFVFHADSNGNVVVDNSTANAF